MTKKCLFYFFTKNFFLTLYLSLCGFHLWDKWWYPSLSCPPTDPYSPTPLFSSASHPTWWITGPCFILLKGNTLVLNVKALFTFQADFLFFFFSEKLIIFLASLYFELSKYYMKCSHSIFMRSSFHEKFNLICKGNAM